MNKVFCILSLIIFTQLNTFSQEISSKMINSISFSKPNENKLSNFIIAALDEEFSVSFDVLSGIEYDLYYTIDHYDFDWKKSELLKSEFIQGFDEVKINNYTSSFNTYQIYTNYNITFPNSETSLKKSGNYIVRILDEYGDELFNRKFILYENLCSVKTEVKRSRELEFINEKQVVNFEVIPLNLQLNNPERNVKTLIVKNNDLNNSIFNLKPQYKIGNKLIYKYDKESSFWGGNEYLYFDNKNIKTSNVEIQDYRLNDIYQNFLFIDYPRYNRKYTYNPDINGGFLINASNVENPSNEADYVDIYFSLENSNNLFNKDDNIYIVGEFNNYSKNRIFKMQYDYKKNKFEAVIKLKQGFYNYKYLMKNNSNLKINFQNGEIGGNFDETENIYSVVVYYRNFGERYDRAIGFGKGSSNYITN